MTPANDNKPHLDLSASLNGYVIRDGRGRAVARCSTLSNAARMLGELQEAPEAVRTMLEASVKGI